jgi:outer membrane murein-binding lipoprotein Lpp
MDQHADSSSPSSSEPRRSVKRRPPAGSPELSPRAAGGEAAELIRRLEELESTAARLRGEKEALEDSARGLQGELEAERASAETAASEAMLMIERLQREKAAAQMEARQFKRYAEGRADHEREVQEEIASLSDLAASYHSRLQSHGIDPDTFSDEEDEELYEEQRGHLEHSDLLSSAMVSPEADAKGDDLLSSAMDVKAMVDEEQEQEQSTAPVEKEFEYTVDVRCASPTMAAVAVVGEYTRDDDVAGNAEGLYARVEALEADRAAMRREMAALRAERAQLVMAREMARRLCWEVVSEQKTIAKKVVTPARSFSALGICKV